MVERSNPLRFARAGLRGLKGSATLALNERVNELWQAGKNVYQLGFGESRFPVHPKIAAALQANVHRRSYLPTLGIRELREVIARFYQRKFQLEASADQVIIGPGSKPLIYAALLALGEEIILPQPTWVSYEPQAQLLSKPATYVPTWPEDGYQPRLETLEQSMAESRRNWGNPEVLVLNSPNNPTGTMLWPDKAQELAQFAREQGLMIVSDEIYGLIAHSQTPHVSPGQYYPEGTVVLGGLSKHLSLGGWRFGVAILPPGPGGAALRRAMQTIANHIWSCVAAPVQYAALVAYEEDPEIDQYVELCTQIHGIRTRYLYETLVELDIPCVEPAGGFYAFPSLKPWQDHLIRRGVHTDEDLAMYLLEHYELAALPGSAFGSPPKALCLRLSSSYLDAGTDEKAENLIETFRKDSDPERFIEIHHPDMRQVASRLADFVNDLK